MQQNDHEKRGIRELLKSKRGGDEEGLISAEKMALYMILAVLMTLIGMVFVMFVTGYQIQENSYLKGVEDIVIQSRFFSSPECFAYQDTATGRVYPGIIDVSKFTKERMYSCYDVPDSFMNGCFRIELDNIDAEAASQKIGVVESKNFGKCLINSGMKKEPYYVLIRKDEGLFAGVMLIESKAG